MYKNLEPHQSQTEKKVEFDPDCIVVRIPRTEYLKNLNSIVRNCEKAIEKDPNNLGAILTKAEYLVYLGFNELALKECNKAIEISPNNPNGYVIRSNVRILLGEREIGHNDRKYALKISTHRDIVEYQIKQNDFWRKMLSQLTFEEKTDGIPDSIYFDLNKLNEKTIIESNLEVASLDKIKFRVE